MWVKKTMKEWERFWMLTFIRETDTTDSRNHVFWLFKCDCWVEKEKMSSIVRTQWRDNTNYSCGCIKRTTWMVIWDKVNRLTLVDTTKERCIHTWHVIGEFECECGNKYKWSISQVKSWQAKSCWCLNKELYHTRNYKHWWYLDTWYQSYRAMIERCTNKDHISYKSYWWRWIRVCDRWLEWEWDKYWYECFLEDMWSRSENTSIDRIDVNWNYCKENCRWATVEEQSYNRRNNKTYPELWENIKTIDIYYKYGISKRKILNLESKKKLTSFISENYKYD